jgi:hypothetical protein
MPASRAVYLAFRFASDASGDPNKNAAFVDDVGHSR